jgi:hypothetical protein
MKTENMLARTVLEGDRIVDEGIVRTVEQNTDTESGCCMLFKDGIVKFYDLYDDVKMIVGNRWRFW